MSLKVFNCCSIYFDHGRLPITLRFLWQSLKTEPLELSQYNLVLNEGNKLFVKCNKVFKVIVSFIIFACPAPIVHFTMTWPKYVFNIDNFTQRKLCAMSSHISIFHNLCTIVCSLCRICLRKYVVIRVMLNAVCVKKPL